MICENCKKNEATIKYYENINGIEKNIYLCRECSEKIKVGKTIDIRMPEFKLTEILNIFLENFSKTTEFTTYFEHEEEVKCNRCGKTFEELIQSGKYGCANCYEIFKDKMDPILLRIQGSNRHCGRIGKISDNKLNIEIKKENEKNNNNLEENKNEKLKEKLKKAIKEEKYEEAAKIRDQINNIKNNKRRQK